MLVDVPLECKTCASPEHENEGCNRFVFNLLRPPCEGECKQVGAKGSISLWGVCRPNNRRPAEGWPGIFY